MALQIPIQSDVFKILGGLALVKNGLTAYYDHLRTSSDPVVAVGAVCAMLDTGIAHYGMWDQIVSLSGNFAVKVRAFPYFNAAFERDLARTVALTPTSTVDAAESDAMLATISFDHVAALEADKKRYLATAQLNFLERASVAAAEIGGWRAALEWAVKAVAISPLNPGPIARVNGLLEEGANGDLLAEFASILQAAGLHPGIAPVFAAGAALKRGDAVACLAALKAVNRQQFATNPGTIMLRGAVGWLEADAKDKLGAYKEAYAAYKSANEAERAPRIDPEDYYRGIEARGKIRAHSLPKDPRSDVVQMLGFPRSGTTLLENAFAAHAGIETFEEIPALKAAIDQIERVQLRKVPAPSDPAEVYVTARRKYYEEIDARRQKPDAKVLIDKLPLRSGDARFLDKLFPDWRYIFSIRHPFDVVLSCFRQRFVPNPAMENFTSIAGAVRAYDKAMSEWFGSHTLTDNAVHYIRYDDLVLDFRKTMSGALEFLGLEWNDDVNDFAVKAETRAGRTPSYIKVRQGLTIGVQSSWRNYGFLFQTPETKALNKWAEFFGYETT
ncbi:MAG: sulfotransferase [Devosia sp.]